MANPSFFGEPRTPRLATLLREVKQGEIQVPRFQRPFVWTDQQRLELLESIYLRYPIGSLLVWRTRKHRLATYDALGPVRLPGLMDSAVHQYLLDGHQRMTTLFAALGPGLCDEDERAEVWDEDDADGEVPRWPIYFDLGAEPGDNPFRLPPRRGGVDPLWLPLARFFDEYALGEFADGLRRAGEDRERVNRARAVAETFRDYTIPIVPIVTEEIEQATNSFKRVNSGGTPMSEVHMINALTWKPEFDLKDRLAEISEPLDDIGWGGFEPQMILNVCKAALDLDIHGSRPEQLAEALADAPERLTEARDAIVKAARVFRRIAGVRGPAVLPDVYQAVLLAEALRDGSVGEMDDDDLQSLRAWFWITTLTEHFQNITGSSFRRARQHLDDLLVWGDTDDPAPPGTARAIDPLTRFDFRSARSKAMAVLLAELKPRKIGLSKGHHSQELLATHGAGAVVSLIARREVPEKYHHLTSAPANRFIAYPRSARELRQHLESKASLEFAHSHAISEEALDALRGGQVVRFLQMREIELRLMEQERAEQFGLEYRR